MIIALVDRNPNIHIKENDELTALVRMSSTIQGNIIKTIKEKHYRIGGKRKPKKRNNKRCKTRKKV